MKRRIVILLISLLLMNYSSFGSKSIVTGSNLSPGDSIKVLSTPDLYNLSVTWADEYNKSYPGTKIKVISVTDGKIADDLLKKGNIGFVSNEYYSGFDSESIQKVVVGRDIIVPVINLNNPFLDQITMRGISPESMALFLGKQGSGTWGDLLETKENSPANYYKLNDESITRGVNGFLKTKNTGINGIEVESAEEMISAIQKDPYALGFCRMINILDFKNQAIVKNIRLLPIDRNGNNLIDYNEKIYDDLNVFSRGVWIGKYPKALFSNIYSVSSGQSDDGSYLAFLKWILNDGQQFLSGNGFNDLLLTERQSAVDNLSYTRIYASANTNEKAYLKTILFIIAASILVGLVIKGAIRYRKRKASVVQKTSSFSLLPVPDEESLVIPKGIYFDKTHTWAFMEQNGAVRVGIDDFLQHVTGPLTRIKLKNTGEKVEKGEAILSIIQNGKQLNLYSPVSGIIREQNKIVKTDSSIINSSPYTDGWIYKIEPTNWLRENQLLFMAEKYKQFIKNEFSRLKEFLQTALKSDTERYAQVIMQDGGEPRDGILSNLGPEVWEDFQTNFIDPSRQIWFYELY